jgi:hypothetical protein
MKIVKKKMMQIECLRMREIHIRLSQTKIRFLKGRFRKIKTENSKYSLKNIDRVTNMQLFSQLLDYSWLYIYTKGDLISFL